MAREDEAVTTAWWQGGKFPPLPEGLFGTSGPFADALREFNPAALMQQNMNLAKSMMEIAMGTSKIAPDARDWRFQDETWTKNPFYSRLGQAYLAMSEAVAELIPDSLAPDERSRAQLATEIVTTAFAPTNTLAGNPAAMLRAIETRGDSLAKGFRNFVHDWLNNEGMPSQVDTTKFAVGKNMATTPGTVVHRSEMFELIQYKPSEETVHEVPLLLIPPQIGRFYFVDLSPGRSFAEYATAQGLNLFVISWRNPGREEREWGLDDYLRAGVEAVESVASASPKGKVNLTGFCAGGILASILAAWFAAKKRDIVNTLAVCVTMLDWENDAVIGSFRLPAMLKMAKAQSEMKGVLSGNDLSKVFTWLRPNDLVWTYWVKNYLMGETPPPFDILAWNQDNTNLPAKLHSDFLEIFEGNPLVRPGAFKAMGEPIDLGKVRCDSFVVGAEKDHLTPWQACYRSCRLLGGDSTFALSNGGHIAALVNPPGNPKSFHQMGPGSAADADDWRKAADKHKGSWWEGYAVWVGERSGPRVPVEDVSSKTHGQHGPAPGKYVFS